MSWPFFAFSCLLFFLGEDLTVLFFFRASLQNTRKRAVTLTEALDASHGDLDSEERESKRNKMGVANSAYFTPGPMNS